MTEYICVIQIHEVFFFYNSIVQVSLLRGSAWSLFIFTVRSGGGCLMNDE